MAEGGVRFGSLVAVQRTRRLRRVGIAILAASAVATVCAPMALGFTLYGFIAGALLLFSGQRDGKAPPGQEYLTAEIETSNRGVSIDRGAGIEQLTRHDFSDGYLDVFGSSYQAVLRTHDGRVIWIRTADTESARDVLRVAGVDAEQVTARMPLVSKAAEALSRGVLALLLVPSVYLVPLIAIFVARAVGESGAWFGVVLAAAALFALAAYFPIARYLLPRSARVGTDGVSIEAAFGGEVIPFARVSGVRCDGRGVWLDLRDGPPKLLATVAKSKVTNVAAVTAALGDRIQEAMSARGGDGDGTRFRVLDRGARDLTAWLEGARALLRRGGSASSYRETAIDVDDLTAVLGDARASVERRIAAAAALGSSGEPALTERVRIAAATCVDARTRIAIERAASGELDEADLAFLAESDARS